jgi:hypothetical protein
MPSKQRSDAARANGAKSKGPVTPQGKDTASRNAIQHGLNSKVVVLPQENRRAFERLRDAYMDRFEPADPVEAGLIETMAAARWRLNRLIAIESKLYEKELVLQHRDISKQFTEIDDEAKLACVFDHCANQGKSLAMLVRYEGQLNRTYDRAFKQLHALQKPQPPAPPQELQNEPKPLPAPAPSRAHPAPQSTTAEPPRRPKSPASRLEAPISPRNAPPPHPKAQPSLLETPPSFLETPPSLEAPPALLEAPPPPPKMS